ncbi:hypothetical protein Dred_2113 [Desulforamulus reducens MI-1]|uniref:Putative Flp pilus-assembly TadG-like N-terminal domain-containing protein n=1 Tax=Desulforamulus reducens (strain ATCC BAA-1160 / DSM 100696 / MI-1) TaxID=349161 RepID=A4J6C7_DESRM|nr:pilus assembly protein TadG-related protein [Desulforamulus reducens]ABO50630.1 hypothetical protein Dred_2113 [Desulforamulus reducens MI-1]
MKKRILSFFSDDRGLAVVLVSLAMTVLIGAAALVTDVGLVTLVKNRLSNAADAASLAGAQELPDNPNTALSIAHAYALSNGLSEEQIDIHLVTDPTDTYYDGVKVDTHQTVDYIMAKALGFTSANVQATATAKVLPITSASGAVPLFIPDTQPLIFGQHYDLRSKDADFGPGNFGALDFGSGSKTFEETLAEGFQGEIKVNYQINTLTGVIKNKTMWGIQSRINQCTHNCTPDNFQPDCPRVLIMPVVHYDSLNGTKPVTIVGFAAFLVDAIKTDGSGTNNPILISGTFIKTLTEGAGSLTQTDYGLRTAKLVE